MSETDREVLATEALRWKYQGAKEQHIRETFGWSATRYYQVLDALLERPEVEAVDPVTVHRLRRLRDLRRQQRSPRRATEAGQ